MQEQKEIEIRKLLRRASDKYEEDAFLRANMPLSVRPTLEDYLINALLDNYEVVEKPLDNDDNLATI